MTKPRAQFIDPRQTGLRGLDLKQPVFSPEAIARADQALQSIGGSMQEWLDADIERLQQARLAAEAEAWSTGALEQMAGVAHELKGMGATYGFPLVTQIGASLCRLIETESGKAVAQADPSLVCAHVDALRAAVRDQIKTDGHPVGRALLVALETHVAKLGVAPR
jgi:HPt (histidine-containing phosphotransfer) domain-containing protein